MKNSNEGVKRKRGYFFKKIQRVGSLIGAAIIIGALSAFIADSLKVITEHYEHILFKKTEEFQYLIFLFPVIGLTIIHLLKTYVFRNKPNKGIREVMDAVDKEHTLPAYKIPSHYFNGFLTVIFGGSTGVEVSTVVATAALGAIPGRKMSYLRKHKSDLICAGLAAGVTALFNAPLAGLCFALEVFLKKRSKLYMSLLFAAVTTSYAIARYFFYKPAFHFSISSWQYKAIPYFAVTAVLAGIVAVYLSKSVLWFKSVMGKFPNSMTKIGVGATVISVLLFFCPFLYGEGYDGINHIASMKNISGLAPLLPILIALILKPLATSATLGAGGDGGVFAPSLFAGGFLGLMVALVLNFYFDLGLVPVNFILIGMAAVLSGCIHAPFTAIFLVCAIAGNYVLIVPLFLVTFIAREIARFLLPYNVYTYGREVQSA